MLTALLLASALATEPAFDDGLRVEKGAMGALASWSVANLAVGLPAGLSSDGRSRGFWLGNAGWNTVNLGIAAAGGLGLRKRSLEGFPGPEAMRKQHRGLRTALAVNAGLDVAYIATGLLLRGLSPDRPERQGLGDALVAQGAFLLVFDTTFLAIHRRATRR